jgi:hypothetical protein
VAGGGEETRGGDEEAEADGDEGFDGGGCHG